MRALVLWLILGSLAWGQATKEPAPIYYLLWFDTEDYITPASDDAALRLAQELDKLGVRATFKVVGEKARVLEQRGRRDVIQALARHDIGYHSNNHSIPPSPAVYLRPLGWLEGAAEFERREGPGAKDVARIFGQTPSCYGQPGNSWGPQSTLALRRMGIPTYMDEARQVGLNQQPFWYGGVLHVLNLRQFSPRANLNAPADLAEGIQKFDAAVAELRQRGGPGFIQSYYHPTEWVTTAFWDGVNFGRGRYTAPADYRQPQARTPEATAQAYRIFLDFIRHVQKTPGIRFVTARELPILLADPVTRPTAAEARAQFRDRIDLRGPHSAADLLLALLGITPRYVDGPSERVATTAKADITRAQFDYAKRQAIAHIEQTGRLPSHVFIESATLSLGDFASMLAYDDGSTPQVALRQGQLAFERHIATDGRKTFDWVIHPEGFDGSALLELGRLQAWTLKPARVR
ncbi:MAG: hypothetical protein K2X03_27430 [Bryobacteraceae bacterium]|nr:hypothetical protein [Bryobacteraceae bacterium]